MSHTIYAFPTEYNEDSWPGDKTAVSYEVVFGTGIPRGIQPRQHYGIRKLIIETPTLSNLALMRGESICL